MSKSDLADVCKKLKAAYGSRWLHVYVLEPGARAPRAVAFQGRLSFGSRRMMNRLRSHGCRIWVAA
jgi:hypothetical protein